MKFDNLKATLERNVGKYYPGVDIVIHHEGKEVFRHQAGCSNLETKAPVNPNALYYIFSCSKPATCMAALQFFEKGYYRLTDPVYDFIPEFKDVVVRRTKPNGAVYYESPKTPITIGHLFSMTSGIDYDLNTEPIEKVKEDTKGRMPTLEVVKAIAKNPLHFHPGEHFLYGLNHDVLGGLIEVWSGMKFGEYMEKNVFSPCGMKETGFKVTPQVKARFMEMARADENGKYQYSPSFCGYCLGEDSDYESGGAGIITSVSDYIQVADAMANGGVSPKTGERLLSQRTIDMMRSNRLTREQLDVDYVPKSHSGYGYGLGVKTAMTNAKGLLETVGTFGWDGAAGCYFSVSPEDKLAVFMARNARPAGNDILPVMVMNSIYSENF